jgi:hypothetical protein
VYPPALAPVLDRSGPCFYPIPPPTGWAQRAGGGPGTGLPLLNADGAKYYVLVFRCPNCGCRIPDKLIVAHAGRIGKAVQSTADDMSLVPSGLRP